MTIHAPSLEIMALLVSVGSLAVAGYSASAASKSASASERSALEAKRSNDIAVHGLRRAIYDDVIWIRGKIISAPSHISREDIIKFYNSTRYSRFYFGNDAHAQLKKFLDEIDKYQLTEFREQLSKQEVISELRRLADKARDALEPHMSLSR